MEPLFLTTELVLELHRIQVDRFGGLHGLRDRGLLESAMAMPQAGFGGEYAHADVFEMAAAYLFHLTSNHPFLDGNKRVGAMAADTFLHINGIELVASAEDYEAIVLEVAKGQMDKAEIADFFRQNSTAAT